jgi:ABC-type branched-subunit amino acid transport system ATPase component
MSLQQPVPSARESADPGAPLLNAEGLNAGYGDVNVLWDVSLEVYPGEIVALVGSNGAGKTTLLRVLSGLLKPTRGSIRFREEDVTRLRADELVERRLIHVPEGRHLFPDLTVEQNLILGAVSRRDRRAVRQDLDRVYQLFPRLKERRKQAAGSMSGGEQQMCAIGRGMMSVPLLLMIDEMSLGLAPVLVDQLLSAVVKLRGAGVTLLMVEQDIQTALESADRGYVLETGHISMTGAAKDLLEDPRVRTAYLGL